MNSVADHVPVPVVLAMADGRVTVMDVDVEKTAVVHVDSALAGMTRFDVIPAERLEHLDHLHRSPEEWVPHFVAALRRQT
jgi:hypothetical protein